MATDLDAYVQVGRDWLDAERPGWRERVKFDDLDMGNCNQCVLGQLHGWFYDALNDIGKDFDWAEHHGFMLNLGYSYQDGYARLTAAWRRVVAS